MSQASSSAPSLNPPSSGALPASSVLTAHDNAALAALPSGLREPVIQAAARHNLPPALVAAIVRVESDGNTFAIRYEPGFFDRYVRDKGHRRFAPCSKDTEERARATSFGLMQVMGQTAREEGFAGTYLTALCDPAVGLNAGCSYLAKLARTFPAPKYAWDMVAAAYNGGPGAVKSPAECRNPDYPAAVLRALGGSWPQRKR